MFISVLMSGGVDSSVAAALLLAAGHEAEGVTFRLWGADSDTENAVSTAADTCRLLGMPHRAIDLRKQFSEGIISYFINSYAAGETPNPCVFCNPAIKFGAALDACIAAGSEMVATGHYVRIGRGPDGGYELLRAADAKKDQSYFLHRLGQAQLSRIIFPLGGMTKDDVRAEARRLGLPAAESGESQEVCFIPDDDYRGFMEKMRPGLAAGGEFVDASGMVLGRHRGTAFYTVGQRKGLGVSSPLGRRYVLKRDSATGRIVLGSEEDLLKDGCTVRDVNWVSGAAPRGEFRAGVRLRYRSAEVPSTIYPQEMNARIVFDRPDPGVSPGQSAVFYDGEKVLGGGVIE